LALFGLSLNLPLRFAGLQPKAKTGAGPFHNAVNIRRPATSNQQPAT
jgi:hypothetical protein